MNKHKPITLIFLALLSIHGVAGKPKETKSTDLLSPIYNFSRSLENPSVCNTEQQVEKSCHRQFPVYGKIPKENFLVEVCDCFGPDRLPLLTNALFIVSEKKAKNFTRDETELKNLHPPEDCIEAIVCTETHVAYGARPKDNKPIDICPCLGHENVAYVVDPADMRERVTPVLGGMVLGFPKYEADNRKKRFTDHQQVFF